MCIGEGGEVGGVEVTLKNALPYRPGHKFLISC